MLNRRDFLKALGIGAAAVAAPVLVEPVRKLWFVGSTAPVGSRVERVELWSYDSPGVRRPTYHASIDEAIAAARPYDTVVTGWAEGERLRGWDFGTGARWRPMTPEELEREITPYPIDSLPADQIDWELYGGGQRELRNRLDAADAQLSRAA